MALRGVCRRLVPLTAALVTAAVALTVCLAAAPVASAMVTPRQIDAFLLLHDSPLAGEGAAFCAAGERSGVDPAFLVAISGAESSFGDYLYSAGSRTASHNAFNWFYGATRAGSAFASWQQAIDTVAAGLRGSLYYGAGRYSVGAIAPVYCPQGTQAWVANVTAYLLVLGGDPNDTRLRAAPAVAGPAAARGEPLVAAGVASGLVVVRPFTLAPGTVVAGSRLRLRFALVNEGPKASVWSSVILRLAGPAGRSVALGTRAMMRLEPGATHAFTAAVDLRTTGVWKGWVEIVGQRGVTFVDARPAVSIVVTPAAEKSQRTGAAAGGDQHERAAP
jgi:hypothetical protein